jgi:hypothetical protein
MREEAHISDMLVLFLESEWCDYCSDRECRHAVRTKNNYIRIKKFENNEKIDNVENAEKIENVENAENTDGIDDYNTVLRKCKDACCEIYNCYPIEKIDDGPGGRWIPRRYINLKDINSRETLRTLQQYFGLSTRMHIAIENMLLLL